MNVLRYEIKRNLLPLVVLTVIACLVAVVGVFGSRLAHAVPGSDVVYYHDAGMGIFAAIGCVLATLVPILQFSYRMKMRSVDLWSSLPMSRKKLAWVRVFGGLVLVLGPFTLSFWLGVACIAMQGFAFAYAWHLVFYGATVCLLVALFGVNSFLFTRGNTVLDGIVILLLWTCLLPLAVMVFGRGTWGNASAPTVGYSVSQLASAFFPQGGVGWLADVTNRLACHDEVWRSDLLMLSISLPLLVAEGIGGYLALFLSAGREKGENAEQVNASWLGYRVLLPAFFVLLLGLIGRGRFSENLPLALLTAIVVAVGYFVWRRSFKVKREDVIVYVLSLLLGVAIGLLVGYFL